MYDPRKIISYYTIYENLKKIYEIQTLHISKWVSLKQLFKYLNMKY